MNVWKLMICLSLLTAATVTAADTPAASELAAKFPIQQQAPRDEACAELIKRGAPAIQALCKALLPEEPGKDDNKVRFALRALSIYVTRPGAEADRKLFATAVAESLNGEAPASSKTFLLEQLRVAGTADVVAPIAKLLVDKNISEPAAHALLAIGGASIAPAFRAALANTQGGARATVITALGTLRDKPSVAAIIKDAESTDKAVRSAALIALGEIGDASAAATLAKASTSTDAIENATATQAYAMLAQRLGDDGDGDKDQAAKICRELIKTRTDASDKHVRCAALYTLARALGEGAFNDLLEAMKSDTPEVRAAAGSLARTLPGQGVTRRWMEQLGDAKLNPAGKAEILNLLASRGDAVAFPAAVAALKDSDATVRLAAIRALRLGNSDAIAPLVALLDKGEPAEQTAARSILAKLGGENTTAGIVKALDGASPAARKALLGVLADSGASNHIDVVFKAAKDPEESVRIAALTALEALASSQHVPQLIELLKGTTANPERVAAEKALGTTSLRTLDKAQSAAPIAAALAGTPLPVRTSLMKVLKRIGQKEGLDPIVAQLKDESPEIKEAALREIADWQDSTALDPLIGLAKTAPVEIQKILALRGYIRIVSMDRKRAPEDAIKLYRAAMDAAVRPDEKKMIIGGLGEVRSLDALAMLESSLANDVFREEAAGAIHVLCKELGKTKAAECRAALGKVLEVSTNENLKKEVKETLTKLPAK